MSKKPPGMTSRLLVAIKLLLLLKTITAACNELNIDESANFSPPENISGMAEKFEHRQQTNGSSEEGMTGADDVIISVPSEHHRCGVKDLSTSSKQFDMNPTSASYHKRLSRKARQVLRSGNEKPLKISNDDDPQHFIELHLVVDKQLYQDMDSSDVKVKNFAASVIGYTSGLLQPLGVRLILKKLEIWRTENLTPVTASHVDTLDHFGDHRYNLLTEGVESDVTVLLTNVDFSGITVGYALVDTMCQPNSVGVVQNQKRGPSSVAHTMAHEIGHVLGMNHDNDSCACQERTCVMAASLSNTLRPKIPWSGCSTRTLTKRLEGGNFPCLDNRPAEDSRNRIVFCGDGVVEGAEQCDCGPINFCENPCCDAQTCKFSVNATCASGPCCDLKTCQPAAAATVCRRARNACDLPEFCSGDSETCPSDAFVANGELCDSSLGRCYEGNCGNSRRRCQALFGEDADVAPEKCFRNNGLGNVARNCGMERQSGLYKKCHRESVQCGSIYCSKPSRELFTRVKMSVWRFGECFTAFSPNISYPDFELSPNGAICSDGKMCVDQECVKVQPNGCGPSGCGPHGTCNNNGHCHCDSGYAPPTCLTPGYGGSVDSGHSDNYQNIKDAENILLVLFVCAFPLSLILAAVIAGLNVWWHKNGRHDKKRDYHLAKFLHNFCFCKAKLISEGIDADYAILTKDPIVASHFEKHKTMRNSNNQTRITLSNSHPSSRESTPPLQFAGTNLIHNSHSYSPKLPFNRPKYNQSCSVDSGCVSETDSLQERKPLRQAPAIPVKNSRAISPNASLLPNYLNHAKTRVSPEVVFSNDGGSKGTNNQVHPKKHTVPLSHRDNSGNCHAKSSMISESAPFKKSVYNVHNEVRNKNFHYSDASKHKIPPQNVKPVHDLASKRPMLPPTVDSASRGNVKKAILPPQHNPSIGGTSTPANEFKNGTPNSRKNNPMMTGFDSQPKHNSSKIQKTSNILPNSTNNSNSANRTLSQLSSVKDLVNRMDKR